MANAARLFLACGLVGIAVYVAFGGSTLIYEGFGICAAAAILAGIARNRPRKPLGWLLIGASQLVAASADVLFFSVYGGSPSFPSPADGLYLVSLLLFGAGLMTLVGSREALRRDALSAADAAVLALALGLFLWSIFFSGALGKGTGLSRAVSIAYPVLDLVLLAVLVRCLLERGRRAASYWLLTASVLLLVLSDAWYVVPALTDQYVAGTWRDAGWLGSYLLAGAAALDPSMRVFVKREPYVIPVRRVVLLGTSLVLVAAAALLSEAISGRLDVYAFAGFGGAMAAFITFRIAGLVRQLESTRRAAVESERRFRLIFEQSPLGISVGRDGLMSETNPALQQMLGFSGEELARKHYLDVTHPDDHALTEQAELDLGERDSFSMDKRYVRRDGTTVETHVNVALDLQDGLGISIIEDVTERRQLEEQVRQAQKLDAVGKLAGGVAHDFNNLMTAVIGYSDLLLRSLDGDPRAEKVTAIRDSALRASDLTRQLLAFGRRQVLQTEDVDLRSVVAGLDSTLRRLVGDGVALETIYGDAPLVVRADRGQLEHVVLNLVANARDAMPVGGVLTVAVVSDGADAILTVADTGTGMDEQTLGRIFEPFFSTKPLGESTGLGLSTVHGIVGQSGGTIQVDSTPGRGSVFTVRLPLTAVLPQSAALATLVD